MIISEESHWAETPSNVLRSYGSTSYRTVTSKQGDCLLLEKKVGIIQKYDEKIVTQWKKQSKKVFKKMFLCNCMALFIFILKLFTGCWRSSWNSMRWSIDKPLYSTWRIDCWWFERKAALEDDCRCYCTGLVKRFLIEGTLINCSS